MPEETEAKGMLITSTTNLQRCEACGSALKDRYVRNQVARDSRYCYARTRQNRTRIPRSRREAEIERLCAAGIAHWQGLLVCEDCLTRWRHTIDPPATSVMASR